MRLELSTANKLGYNLIVIVLNNHVVDGRFLQDGPFNDIPTGIITGTQPVGKRLGLEVHTEGELEKAIQASHEQRQHQTGQCPPRSDGHESCFNDWQRRCQNNFKGT